VFSATVAARDLLTRRQISAEQKSEPAPEQNRYRTFRHDRLAATASLSPAINSSLKRVSLLGAVQRDARNAAVQLRRESVALLSSNIAEI